MPILHLVQAEEGYVTPAGVDLAAEEIGLTRAEVGAVATFYTMYKRKPPGSYHVGVCTNTLCAVMGGDAIYGALKDQLGVTGQDETTADGKISLEHIECNAACDYAPVVMVNWEFFDNMTPGSARTLIEDLQAGRPVKPTRGPDSVPTFKEVELVLAGFPDGRAGEGCLRRSCVAARSRDRSRPQREGTRRAGRRVRPDRVRPRPSPPRVCPVEAPHDRSYARPLRALG